jgi:hypothetical protein
MVPCVATRRGLGKLLAGFQPSIRAKKIADAINEAETPYKF